MSETSGMSFYLERTKALAPWPWWPEAVAYVDAQMARDSGHDWDHLIRVLHHAHTIWQAQAPAEERSRDWPALALAALMHDVVNLPKDHPERAQASARSAEACAALAGPRGWLSDAQLRLATSAIRTHSYSRGERATQLVGQALSDADRLDAIGAIGIARAFAVGGALGRSAWHPDDPMAHEREADDLRWSVDHFFVKLLKLPALMYTATGRALAQARVDFMRAYLTQLERELAGESLL